MSDESTTPSDSDSSKPAQPAPESNPAPAKPAIKIGSQRPGYVPDSVKKKQRDIVPTIPKPTHRDTAKRDDNVPVVTATPPTEPKDTSSEQTAMQEAASPSAEASAPTGAAPPPVETPAQAQAVPAGVEPSDETVEASMTATAVEDIDLEMSDEDLEKEIALAMGENVDGLLAEEVSTKTSEIEEDKRYEATVLRIYRESVIFELPGQQNGAVPLKHFEETPEIGSTHEVVVVGFSNVEQMYDLTKPGASVAVSDWSDIQEGVVVEAKITGHNKGGLECEVNHIRGFIPASQVSLYRVEDFSAFVDQTMQCVVTEAKPEKRNLVLSHRAILEREREAKREELLASLAVGQTLEGTVTRLQQFGAFVDLGGIDGLIHISQLSWDNIRHPSEVVAEGQQVRVRIERVDAETGKIGLSYKDLSHHPWEGIDSKYPVGEVVTGTVSKIMDFGAFVKLEPGVEGLVHISELSHKRVNRVSHVAEEGQRVEVKVLTVDADAQRISLSMKQAAGAPESSDGGDSGSEAEEAVVRPEPKVPLKSLKGGVERPSGGDQFGLKW